jgi:hypothetical protein
MPAKECNSSLGETAIGNTGRNSFDSGHPATGESRDAAGQSGEFNVGSVWNRGSLP